jgi:hypothetical protein
MVFNATFNNISVISWRSDLLVGEPEYLEKTTDLSTLSYNVVSSTPCNERNSNSPCTFVVIGTDCEGSCKSNYHMITTTPWLNVQMKNSIILSNVYKAHNLCSGPDLDEERSYAT